YVRTKRRSPRARRWRLHPMRGADSCNVNPFTTLRLDGFVSANYPLWPIRTWASDTLASWRGEPHSNGTHQSIADDKSRLCRKSNAVPALPTYPVTYLPTASTASASTFNLASPSAR